MSAARGVGYGVGDTNREIPGGCAVDLTETEHSACSFFIMFLDVDFFLFFAHQLQASIN